MLFCVLDGHGPKGAYASHYVRDHFPDAVIAQGNLLHNDIEQAFVNACQEVSCQIQYQFITFL